MEYYIAVLTFTFAAGITPGPNTIMLLVSGLNHGISKSLPHYFGICIGFPLMVTAIGFGLGMLFIQYPLLHHILKVMGISYLLYLAWKIANAGNPHAKKDIKAPFTFLQAAIFQWVNPKAWIIAIGAIASFTTQAHIRHDIAFIVASYLLMGFITMGAWLYLGASLHRVLNNEKRVKYFNIVMAILLVASIIPIAITGINTAS